VKRFVLDASVALGWFVDRPAVPYAAHIRELLLLGSRAIIPALWHLEIANGFMVAERRGPWTAADTTEALRTLDVVIANGIETCAEPAAIRGILALARQFRLTANDAVYLETALHQGLPIATLDRQLRTAASAAGVGSVQ
jgi:predicted nucleic acid-binding protein